MFPPLGSWNPCDLWALEGLTLEAWVTRSAVTQQQQLEDRIRSWHFYKVKIKRISYILAASYLGTFLRFFIDNNFIISLLGSFFVGFIIRKRLNHSSREILLTGFFSCFTSFSGFIYFFYKIFNKGDLVKFIISFNLIIISNLFIMYLGFCISRKIT